MAKDVHFISEKGDTPPTMVVRDDRGIPISELELPPSVTGPEQVDDELRKAGWTRSADWAVADDGWVAPVKNPEEL